MSYYCDVFIIENGRKLNLFELDEETLDSLRDCIFNIIPHHSKLCMTCDKDNLNGLVYDLSFQEYIDLSDKPMQIFPSDTSSKIWKNDIILYMKRNLINLNKFKNIELHLKSKIKIDTQPQTQSQTKKEKRLLLHHEAFQKFYKQLEDEKKHKQIEKENIKQVKKSRKKPQKVKEPSRTKYGTLRLISFK